MDIDPTTYITLFGHRKFTIAQTMIERLAGVPQWRRGTSTVQSGIQFNAFVYFNSLAFAHTIDVEHFIITILSANIRLDGPLLVVGLWSFTFYCPFARSQYMYLQFVHTIA